MALVKKLLLLFQCLAFLFLALPASAQPLARPTNRITVPIDERVATPRKGDVHPLARSEYDRGRAPAETRMDRMVLVLQPDSSQRQALEDLLAAQQDPASPEYQQWLTPEAFGERFGVSPSDTDQIVGWLQGAGFAVEPVSPARRTIVFSGTAGQVMAAFHADIHLYQVNGAMHRANATPPEFPQALDAVVAGIASLHDFYSAPQYVGLHRISGMLPQWTSGSSHYLTPGDFGVIYDVASLYAASTDGTGQSIAVLGRTNINVSDVTLFRSTFGLPVNNPTIVLNGANPGIANSGDETESLLDVEWSGAVAPKAAIKLVVSASTASSDGVALSAQYAVTNKVAPVITLSYGLCELAEGSSGNQFWNNLWQQAAGQGIAVFVSAGDSGAAGCDNPNSSAANYGDNVNGLCSSPYSTCVGGTQFSDTANPTQYWSANNGANYTSALSYIPEAIWNQSLNTSGGSGLWAGGGGASAVYSKPSWQTGPGVPADGKRDVPDVSLTASTHDGYVICLGGSLYLVGGTSAAAPSFAGLIALATQRKGSNLGNVNPSLYGFATRQASGGAAVFHDVTAGNNTVPGVTGFNAGVGYDLASGLGSVDAALLVGHWNDSAVPSFQLSATPSSLTVTAGSTTTATVRVTPGGGFNSAVALSASGLPTGVTASFAPATLPAGTTSSALTLSATAKASAGAFSFNITGVSGALNSTVAVPTAVSQPCTYSLSPTSANAASTASNASLQVTAGTGCSWTAASTVSWITRTSSATGSGNGTVAYSVAANTATTARTGSITITGAGQTTPVTFGVSQSAVPFALGSTSANVPATASTGTIAVTASSSTATWTAVSNNSWITVTAGASGKGNQNVGYSVAANTAAAARTGTITVAALTFTVTQAAAPCSYSVTPTSATEPAAANSYTLQVTATAGCAWTAVSNSSFLSVTAGASGSGNGSVTYATQTNTSSARSGTLTVAGVTINIAQSAASTGTPVYSLNPPSATVNAATSTGSVAVTSSIATATWTAVSKASWIAVTSGASGKGSQNVGYSVAANTATTPRTGTITIAGLTFTVTQSGHSNTACTYTVGNAAITSGTAGATFAFPVTAPTGCSWTAVSNESWLIVESGATGTGNGTATFLITPNTTGATRNATMVIAGTTITLTESSAPTGGYLTKR